MTSNINKVLVSSILSLSFSFVSSITLAATQPAKIDGTSVNFRKAPNTSAGIIKKLSNSRVSVLDKSSGWYKISFDGKAGWVKDDYIKVLTTKGSINANGVNFRSNASTTSKVISSLKNGTSVVILDSKKDWNKVKVGSKVGYVATKFVTEVAISKNTTRSTATTSKKSARSTAALAIPTDSDDSNINNVVSYAKKFIGVKYVYGGMSPNGFDCSGFIGYVYKNFGVNLNRTAEGMYSNGYKVSKSALQAGDLLFFDASSRKTSGAIDHAGIYLGGNTFIHASSSNGEVRIQSLSEYRGNYIGARRVN